MSDLKPCPFCGCAMNVRSNRDWHRPDGDHDELCPVYDDDLMFPATEQGMQALLAMWNRRTQPEAAPAPEPEFICEITEGTVRINPYGDEPIISGKRTYTVNIPAAQDLSAAILAIDIPSKCLTHQASVYGFEEGLKAAAALASSANALSAGDRVDADLSKYLRHLPDCGSWVKEVDTYDENDMWSGTTKVSRPCTCGLDAILQSQKGNKV